MNYERDIEKYLVRQVENYGGLCLKLGREGWPDRIAVMPCGAVDFIELKREDGRMSELQKKRLLQLSRRKAKAFVFYSKSDVDEYIADRVAENLNVYLKAMMEGGGAK